jgi:hypothetical protein
VEHVAVVNSPDAGCGTRTPLSRQAPAFQPVSFFVSSGRSSEAEVPVIDSRLTAVVNAVHLVLVSSPSIRQIHISKDGQGGSTLIAAEVVPSGKLSAATASYDLLQSVRHTMESVAARLGTARLVSARSQKDDSSYTLRSKFACWPEYCAEGMCWDMFQKGYCPRGSLCRWSHPCDEDVFRIKVVLTHSSTELAKQGKELAGACEPVPATRHKILLGELLE